MVTNSCLVNDSAQPREHMPCHWYLDEAKKEVQLGLGPSLVMKGRGGTIRGQLAMGRKRRPDMDLFCQLPSDVGPV
jgi:hypothetical protein